MHQFDYYDFGLDQASAKIGFCFKDVERSGLLMQDYNTNEIYTYRGPLARFKISGGYEFTVDQAKNLRDLLNLFIERAEL